ncbi:response regulator [Microvirga aerilata]|uniref:Response regulator n=1 Tax=Microvirga aerilata TaxID=670292 RepID=A0A936Z7Q4_9HYPH|nr:response regulator [Microvirga aerilata]
MSHQQSLGVVLLVEDEPLVRLVVADILMEANFHVIEASGAEEALKVLRAMVRVDVMLSDVEMPPGINGYELARQVHESWPGTEILITSGREWPRGDDLPPGAAFLAKPCPNATLVSHVQAAVRRAQAARNMTAQQDRPDTASSETAAPIPKTA